MRLRAQARRASYYGTFARAGFLSWNCTCGAARFEIILVRGDVLWGSNALIKLELHTSRCAFCIKGAVLFFLMRFWFIGIKHNESAYFAIISFSFSNIIIHN